MDGMNAASLVEGGPWDIGSMPLDDQKRFLLKYCEDHPKANYLAGVMGLYRQLPAKPAAPKIEEMPQSRSRQSRGGAGSIPASLPYVDQELAGSNPP